MDCMELENKMVEPFLGCECCYDCVYELLECVYGWKKWTRQGKRVIIKTSPKEKFRQSDQPHQHNVYLKDIGIVASKITTRSTHDFKNEI
jgi:hypothetical protein